MKVSKLGVSKTASSVRRKKKPAGKGGEFTEYLKEAAAVAEAPEAVEPSRSAPVGSVLAVQESPDSTDGRSRGLMKHYGDEILDRLEDLRHGLLTGAVSKDKLAGLAQKLRAQQRKSGDPRLNEIIDEIELHAEVEIAKLTRNV